MQKIKPLFFDFRLFLIFVSHRFIQDSGPRTAGGLSYVTLLSLAPVLVIAFAMIGAFPAFSGMENQLQKMIFDTFVPTKGSAIQQYFTDFAKNAGKLTTIGVISLVVTVVLLLWNIQTAFDSIWKSTARHSSFISMLKFWALVTLGPLLFGTSLSISSLMMAQVFQYQVPGAHLLNSVFGLMLPSLVEWLAFFLLFAVIPNTHVKWVHAAIGAVVTAVLFKILKLGFAFYISSFPTYEAIYGALAVIPVLLVWIYLSWLGALLGAQIVANLPNFGKIRSGDWKKSRQNIAVTLAVALKILQVLLQASTKGSGVTAQELFDAVPDNRFDALLQILIRKNYVLRAENGSFCLLADLQSRSLKDLAQDFNLIWEDYDAKELPFLAPILKELVQQQSLLLKADLRTCLIESKAEMHILD